MQSKMLSTFLCSAVVASCLFAQPQGSEPVQGGGFSFGSFLDEPNDTRPAYTPGEPRPGAPRVSEPRPAQINTYQLGTVEVTAPRAPDENPTVLTVTREQMDKQGSLDVGEALRFQPGLFLIPATNGGSGIYIRGFDESDSGYYLDGIPVNDIYDGNAAGATDLATFFTYGLSAIQVSKGYTSPVFSAGKMGGAINFVSSVPVRNLELNLGYKFIANNEHRINAQVGRNLGNQYFQLTYSYMTRKSLHYSYDFVNNNNGTYSGAGPTEIPNTTRRIYMLSGKYGFFLGDNHEYSLNFYHQHQKYMWANGSNMPYDDKTAFYVLGDSKFSDLFGLNSKIWYHMNMNSTGNRTNWSSVYNDYSIGITEALKFDFSEDQNFKLGFTLKNEHHDARDYESLLSKREWDVLNQSYFAEYALRANDMLRFALSGSYDRHDGLRIINREEVDVASGGGKVAVNPPKPATHRHLWGWTLQGIAYFNPIEPLTFHANVGHKTNLPKVRALYGIEDRYGGEALVPNNDLRSESLINYEVGVDFGYAFDSVGTSSFGATAFFNDVNSMIITEMVDSSLCGATTCYRYTNAYDGYSVGGEIYAKQGFFGDALTLGANWTLLQRKFRISEASRGDESNKSNPKYFTTHPRQTINMLVQIAPSRDYDINLNGSVQTSRWAYDGVGELVKLPTVVLFDLTTNYRLTKRLSLTAGAYNLFDRNYNYETSYADAVEGGFPGRRVFAGFEYNYHR